MYIIMIAAMDRNRLIGNGTQIPWAGDLPGDLKRFRANTMGHPVIMGRKTFESIAGPLDGRTNIVLSTKWSQALNGVLVAQNKTEALQMALHSPGAENIYVIGGAEVYAQFLNDAKAMLLSVVDSIFSGNVYFPKYDKRDWGLTYRQCYPADQKNKYPCEVQFFDRH